MLKIQNNYLQFKILNIIKYLPDKTATYQIRFSNYHYDLTWDGKTGKKIRSLLHADIQVIKSLDHFWLNDILKEFGFSINKNYGEVSGETEIYMFISP